ncbi:MAG: heme lyase CcmF/NrfE family subunit [Candidatus Eisenbacteria bacterium]|nr:heme lyase CcmF/NrfE family subunit [Candidatus Eisenbacteria bacterium]
MILGYVLTWTGFISALAASALYLGAGLGKDSLRRYARFAFGLMAACLAASAAYLLYLIINHRFEVEYVAQYSSRELPLYYLISCFWGGQQGTFLLWAMYGGFVGLVLMATSRAWESWTMHFLGLVQCFLLMLLVLKNPFLTTPMAPPDGQGLNPLLQDPWMVIHPPMLFLGFTSMVVPFVFALAALAKNDMEGWIRPVLPWALFGSLVLGTGLVMGGYWAYKVLGWGGYWGWDPVENSSLIPWLTNTALIHGVMLQRSNGSLKRTNLLLAIFSFLMVVWGTFLTRSGVLADFSVHSFLDLGITGHLVAFIVVFAVLGLGLFAWRFRSIDAGPAYSSVLSREFFTLAGVIVLAIGALMTLLGMSSPLLSRLFGPPSSVQTPYYNTVMLPLAVLAAFGSALGVVLKWRANGNQVWRKFLWPLVISGACATGLAVWRVHRPDWLILCSAAMFLLFSNLWAYLGRQQKDPVKAGPYLAHSGFALVLVGVVLSNGYATSARVQLVRGQAAHMLGYDMTYRGIKPTPDGKQMAVIDVQHGREAFTLKPRIYFSAFNQGVMRKPAIRRYPGHDLYVAPIDETNPSLIAGQMELREREVQDIGMYRARFDGLRTENQEAMMRGGSGAIYADLTLTDKDGVEHHVSPALKVSPGQQSHPGSMPGGLGQVELLGMQVGEKKVRLGFRGPGLPPGEVEVTRGEVKDLGAATVQFTGFRIPDMKEMSEGRGTVFADLQVTPRGGRPQVVAPAISIAPPTDETVKAKLPDGAGEVKIVDLKADEGVVKLDWANVPGLGDVPPALEVEVTLKPLIAFFWVGTLMVSVGFLLTLFRRARDYSKVKTA